MTIYTAFCQEKSGRGTVWIDTVEADNIEQAKGRAVGKCSFDWNYDPLEIHILGLAEGEVNVVFWEDLNED